MAFVAYYGHQPVTAYTHRRWEYREWLRFARELIKLAKSDRERDDKIREADAMLSTEQTKAIIRAVASTAGRRF